MENIFAQHSIFCKEMIHTYMLNPGGAETPWDATRGTKRAAAMRAAVDFKSWNMLASRREIVLRDCGGSSRVYIPFAKTQT